MTALRVVIATCGARSRLAATLQSLAGCRLPAGFAGVSVVENGARHDAQRVVQAAPAKLQASHAHIPTGNKDLALNAAVQALPDSCLAVFADDDIRFAPDWLEQYAAAAKGITGGVFFGGPTGVDYERPPDPWLLPHLPVSAVGFEPRDPDPARVHFLGYNWAAFAGDLKRAGLFDPRLGGALTGGPMSDEFEMQDRLRRHGVAARYVPGARVWHYVPADKCTPEWIVQRRFRVGLVQWLEGPTKPPLRTVASLGWRFALGATQLLAGTLARNRGMLLAARGNHSYCRGVIRGYGLRRQDPATNDTSGR